MDRFFIGGLSDGILGDETTGVRTSQSQLDIIQRYLCELAGVGI